MNLLINAWIPTKDGKISLSELLCSEKDIAIELFRDDFEVALIQLLISLTQVVFTPKSAKELRKNESAPMDGTYFKKSIKEYEKYFDLMDLKYPFMQVRGVKKEEITPIQKLYPGMPAGNNHTLFIRQGSTPTIISKVCPSCAVIAVYNQATCTPSFGGGYKASLRGSAPITTLVKGATLRETIWRNILPQDYIDIQYPKIKSDIPNWFTKTKINEEIKAEEIGLFRGLFWQPAHIELVFDNDGGICDWCHQNSTPIVIGFKKEKFAYTMIGQWKHPHSPTVWDPKEEILQEKIPSFRYLEPAWTQLHHILFDGDEKIGFRQSAVVENFVNTFPEKPVSIILGGYSNKQSAVLQRRHEIVSFPEGWSNKDHYQNGIKLAIDIDRTLRKRVYGLALKLNLKSSASTYATKACDFYKLHAESLVHNFLAGMEKRDFEDKLQILADQAFKEAQIYLGQSTGKKLES